MIQLADYWMGRDAAYPLAMTPQIERNASVTVELANKLLTLAKGAGVKILTNQSGGIVASGWRPPFINANTPGASKTSKHMTGQAIDLYDPVGMLDKWMAGNGKVLADLGLWQEAPDFTHGWAHIQTVPPASGNRIFFP